MSHKLAIRPVRVHRFDAELHAHVSRVVGYRAACSCKWRSPVRPDYAAARRDGRDHTAAQRPAASSR